MNHRFFDGLPGNAIFQRRQSRCPDFAPEAWGKRAGQRLAIASRWT
jgi:hypothetical protein